MKVKPRLNVVNQALLEAQQAGLGGGETVDRYEDMRSRRENTCNYREQKGDGVERDK